MRVPKLADASGGANVQEPVTEKGTRGRPARPNALRALAHRSKSSIDIDNNWLITLSDVLSLLRVYFVMSIVIERTASKPAPSGQGSAAAPSLSPIRTVILEEMRSEIKALKMEDDVSVHAAAKGIVITLKEKITFRPGEALTLPGSEPILDSIADTIQRHPSFLVEIEGHTDNTPIHTALYLSNWELSVARATSVLKYFIRRHGVDASRLTIKGNADQKPLASNDTPEERARNRRVEIRLTGQDL